MVEVAIFFTLTLKQFLLQYATNTKRSGRMKKNESTKIFDWSRIVVNPSVVRAQRSVKHYVIMPPSHLSSPFNRF